MNGNTRFVPAISVVLLFAFCLLGWAAEAGAEDSPRIPVGDSPTIGPADAAVTIVQFTEFQCPFCTRVLPTLTQLRRDYPTQVRLVFKHNPLSFHKDADLAAQAALAAGAQGKFWEYHDLLFANQKALKRSDLEKYAAQLGLNMRNFRKALDEGTFVKSIRADQELAKVLGARGTPNFFINGRKLIGAKPAAAFREVIDAELELAKGSTYRARVEANFTKDPPKKRSPNRPPKDDPQIYKVLVGNAPVKGSDNALVTIIVFNDFECPFCSRVQPTLQTLMSKRKYKGKIRIAFKQLPLPFHKQAKPAAEAALAAHAQGKFWEYHDLLFKNQTALERQDLEFYATQVQLDMVAFRAALNDGTYAEQLDADMAQASTFGARGTPHFFINGKRLSGAQPLEKFEAAVDEAMKRAKKVRRKKLSGDALYQVIVKDGVDKYVAAKSPKADDEADKKVWKIDIPRDAPSRGKRNAPVTLVEFSDFQCPFCARVSPTTDAIYAKYRGKIRVVVLHNPLPFHKDAPLAAEAAMAAHAQGKFWEYREVLFANIKALKRPDLERYAQELGLKMKPFRRALDTRKYESKIARDMAMATLLEARGTPTFFINGRKLVGAQPPSKFESMIEAILHPKK